MSDVSEETGSISNFRDSDFGSCVVTCFYHISMKFWME